MPVGPYPPVLGGRRAVAPDSAASNYKLAYDHLIAPAGIPERNVHRIHGELEPREAAALYTAEIRRYFELGSTELPRFDVLHRGWAQTATRPACFPAMNWWTTTTISPPRYSRRSSTNGASRFCLEC